MTAADALCTQPRPASEAVALDGLESILGASGCKPAGRQGQRRNKPLIKANGSQGRLLNHTLILSFETFPQVFPQVDKIN
jgi:hypothetical protein